MLAARSLALTLLLAGLGGCSRSSGDAGAAGSPALRDYGEVMAEVGRRFELAGRAAVAGRWELAGFEVDELDELFEDGLAHAAPPKTKIVADLAGVAASFRATHPPELARAAKAQDPAAFRAAFSRAAATCNGCHEATGLAFIEIPPEPGAAVPALGPRSPSAPKP